MQKHPWQWVLLRSLWCCLSCSIESLFGGNTPHPNLTYRQCCGHPECHWGVIHLKMLVGVGRLKSIKVFYPTDCSWREYRNNLNQATQKMFKAFWLLGGAVSLSSFLRPFLLTLLLYGYWSLPHSAVANPGQASLQELQGPHPSEEGYSLSVICCSYKWTSLTLITS